MRARFLTALFFGGAVVSTVPAHAALVISKGQTNAVDCSGGICNATAADAVLNAKDLANMLSAGNVSVFAEGVATDITIAAAFSWTSPYQLMLGAYGSVNVKNVVTVAGFGGLRITTNVAQTGGLFRLVGDGKISFWDTSSSLIINDWNYKLVNNLPALLDAIAGNASGHYALAKNYDASLDGPFRSSAVPATFEGVFEGLGNAINNLSFLNADANDERISLFAHVGGSGQLADVVITNISMKGRNAYLAPLAAINDGTITHSSATGTLSTTGGNNWAMAGLVTNNNNYVTRSHANVNMDGHAESAGGLVLNNNGTIDLSDASGTIKAIGLAGGLVAYSTDAVVTSLAQGDVTVSANGDAFAGGLIGQVAGGIILQSFATGNVAGGQGVPEKRQYNSGQRSKSEGNELGGLAGFSAGVIRNCYAWGSVTGAAPDQAKHPAVGGLVGSTSSASNASHVIQSYALGQLDANDKKYQGGVIGTDFSAQGTNDAAFWDLDTTGITNPNQGAGNVFDDPGLKGVSEVKFRKTTLKNFDKSVWAENPNINNGYPYLIANPPQQ